MPSILSRLRTHAGSQLSSRQSAQSVPSAPTPAAAITVTTPTHMERAAGEGPINEASTAPTARKIYPDINRLPEDIVPEPITIRHGLPPPVRRGLTSSSNLDASSAPTPTKTDSDSPKASHSSNSSGNPNTPSASGRGFLERLGNWSTFGRHRAPPPSLNEFGEQTSPSAWRTRRTNSRRSSRLSSKTTSMHSTPPENKENTPRLSSQSSFGRRTPATAAARPLTSQRRILTFVTRELGFDSPRTLGHPSLEVIVPSGAPPPTLPSLNHSGLHSRPRTATFPPRAWSARVKNNEGLTTSQFMFGKSVRPYRSLPRVQHIFRTRSNNGGDEGNERSEGEAVVEGAEGDQGPVPVPTMASWPSARPIPQLPGPPSSSTSLSSSSSPSNPTTTSAPAGPFHVHDPIAHNLYDPNLSLFDNVVGMPHDAPRVRDQKPLRSSLKASARPSPTPIASSSSSSADASALMPSFSLVAAAAAASDTAPHQTPLSSPDRSETAKGKRKAEDVDITPPDSKKATFAVPASPRDHIPSLAPSSFHNNKRARLSGPSPSPAPPNTNAHNTGTYSSRTSSRARAPSSTRSATAGLHDNASERERRRSLSQRSIPISALVTPQVPSVGRPSSAYHMRDPRRPPRRMETGWALRFRTVEEDGTPLQAWLFYFGLVIFPLWWIGAVWRVPQTRVVGGTDTEKAVPLDDPQIEFGAF
ncbi:hypothetical protein DFH94DRAFT_204394 [Russula ochroleuca]|uniref:Uncharacterized protein n=1 Tax=Russula ochroleuca TaxID=152965 RepID=A0A9P5MR25_9AGAM|nr:hypothetical protein DFH94DRAFT_204394 [Russula ochroleuca]